MDSITLSAVTQGELLYGLARKGHPATLAKLIREFLFRVETLPWDEQAATVYGDLRASCMSVGITLGALDMMIAAHAIAANTILVTHDKAFSLVLSQSGYDGQFFKKSFVVSLSNHPSTSSGRTGIANIRQNNND